MSKKAKADSKESKKRTLPEELKPWLWKKGQSGNPGGRSKKFTTLLTDAIRDQLGEISEEEKMTYAAIIGSQLVKQAAKEVKDKGLTKQVLTFYRDVRDATEGKPVQKVILDGAGTTDPVERVKELLAGALGRAAGESGTD